ncbi:histidine phosphatase family protein [Chthonobacter rhizosphaerae]|uniref:histidine phosphatase family protein n=1 Tax=Chthonobacter rhizosphaerae TaxID=2735553 RepID=UPI0015EF01B9|nr:histidine phosphatase family protein [Chthonobacter rhizosphaerae]
MTRILHYLTHPQVRIDPAVPVPRWGLSDVGRARVEALVRSGWLAGIDRILSSDEAKAVETAELVADALGVLIEVDGSMHENDRSATGFLPPAEFEAVADRFFASPTESVRGWERAADAQARIVAAVERALAQPHGRRVLVVGHGAVGTLLACHMAGRPISRVHDQPAGGGAVFTADWTGRSILHDWVPMERLAVTASAGAAR